VKSAGQARRKSSMGFLLFVVWFVSSLVFLACIGSYLPDKKGKQTKPLPAFVFVVSAIISTGCFIHWVVGANSADEARVAAHEANESRHAADPAPPDPTDAATDAPLPGPGDDATVSTGSTTRSIASRTKKIGMRSPLLQRITTMKASGLSYRAEPILIRVHGSI
jgi:NADH:ubiquinone oxidoreductase subunit 3 (subunit A)